MVSKSNNPILLRNCKKLFIALSSFFTAILLLSLTIWIILRPNKPQFSLQQINIFQLTLSSGSHIMNSSIHVTLHSTNPNHKVAIHYDDFHSHATYKGQQITLDTSLVPFLQEHEESNLLEAYLVGNGVPVTSSLGYEMARDLNLGRLVLDIKLSGRLRWKVAMWMSRSYGFSVNCVSVLDFGPSMPVAPLTSNQGTHCSTTI